MTSLGDLQSAASAAHGSSSATIPAVARAARTDSPIRGLISYAQDGADLDRRHVETAQVTAGRQTLFQNQLGFIEQSQNTILRSLCAWMLATSAVNAEDKMLMLITSVSRIVIRIVTFDSADSGGEDSDFDVLFLTCYMIKVIFSVNASLFSTLGNPPHLST